jgi:hypothetical protein
VWIRQRGRQLGPTRCALWECEFDFFNLGIFQFIGSVPKRFAVIATKIAKAMPRRVLVKPWRKNREVVLNALRALSFRTYFTAFQPNGTKFQ